LLEFTHGEWSASDLVWGFVDSVAIKVYKTHPDRWVTCGAYTSYKDPPALKGISLGDWKEAKHHISR
jgi:hypothetical protein